MTDRAVLRPTQKATLDFVRSRRRSIVASDPGTGKTAPVIAAVDVPCLVLAPASLLINWRREIETWRPWDRDQFEIVSYSDRDLRYREADDYATVVADEAHYLKNHEAKRTLEGCRLLHQADKAVAVTGTLVPNRPIELWPLLYSLGFTDLSFMSFARHYAAAYTDDFGRWRTEGASNLSELRDLLADHVIRFTKEEAIPELPPKTWRVISLDLPVDRREKDYSLADLRRLDDAVAFEAMSTILREHGTRKIPAAARYLEEVVLEEEDQVVVFYHHRDVGDGLEDALDHHSIVRVDGSTPLAARQEAVDAFQAGEARIFLGQIQAAGVGLTLTAARRVVMVEASWVPSVLDQGADRCHRIGSSGNVLIDVLTIHRSIDEAQVRRAIEKKLKVIDPLVPSTSADTFATT